MMGGIHDVFVPEGGEDASYRWLADLTADGIRSDTHGLHDSAEHLELLDPG